MAACYLSNLGSIPVNFWKIMLLNSTSEPLSKVQFCFDKTITVSSKMRQCSSDSKYTTFKQMWWLLVKVYPFKDIKVRKSDLAGIEHEMFYFAHSTESAIQTCGIFRFSLCYVRYSVLNFLYTYLKSIKPSEAFKIWTLSNMKENIWSGNSLYINHVFRKKIWKHC